MLTPALPPIIMNLFSYSFKYFRIHMRLSKSTLNLLWKLDSAKIQIFQYNG